MDIKYFCEIMKTSAVLLLLVLLAHEGLGFTNPSSVTRTAREPPFVAPSSASSVEKNKGISSKFLSSPSLAGFITGITGFIGQGIAADDYELAELPPPYIPALFGVVLLAGVGVLTSSLGNVMDEEAGLGMQSGARAKKEIERSRSSYFGKRPR